MTTLASKSGDPVGAVVIAPSNDGRLTPGVRLLGSVKQCTPSTDGKQAVLWLIFDRIQLSRGASIPVSTKVIEVDNARETVDAEGRILGITAAETLTAQADRGISKVQEKYGAIGDLLQSVKAALVKPVDPDIDYPAGVEMTVALEGMSALHAPTTTIVPLQPFPSDRGIREMVAHQPLRAFAANPPRPSDITNLLIVGSQTQLKGAFEQAGWTTSVSATQESKLETFRALMEDRGYKEAPVSTLLLDGRPPEIVFEKSNDTFAARHHARAWLRPGSFDAQPIWLLTATHDTGIAFSDEDHTFIHKIDSQIDRERSKVTNDLLDTGAVRSLELVSRPEISSTWTNATGDPLLTDGRIAVMMLGGSGQPLVP